MRQLSRPFLIGFGLLLMLFVSVPGVARATGPAGDLSVFVSIPPQAWLLEQIGGERLQVRTMLGPSANPHNYDPVARQLVALADAQAYFTIGVPFEAMWQKRLETVNDAMRFIHCGADAPEHAHHDHEHDHGHRHDDDHSDPHIWTSPVEASAIAACMQVALSELDPAGDAHFRANLRRLQRQLNELDAEIRGLLADRRTRYILVQHPAWDYFADEYGFRQIAIEKDGHEPNARHLVAVIERGRELGLRQVFIQGQYSPAAAKLVARAIEAELVIADPMARDYPASLRQLAQALSTAEN